jgi:hypothetical protein
LIKGGSSHEYSYDVEFNASAKILRFHKLFHLLKHSSLLNLVNLKPMCNNFNPDFVCFICVFVALLLCQESLDASYTSDEMVVSLKENR